MSSAAVPNIPTSTGVDFLPFRLQLAPAVPMTQDQFFDFCQQNPNIRFERTAQGELIIMAPSVGDAGFQDTEVCFQLGSWAKRVGKGKVMGPSGGFILPNGANRSPDASWLSPEQLAALTPEQRKKFLPLCPFFLIEVKSPSDRVKTLQEKMDEYIANGCQLGWLIDPERRHVHVYRPGQPVQLLDGLQSISAEPELPEFTLDLQPVWEP